MSARLRLVARDGASAPTVSRDGGELVIRVPLPATAPAMVDELIAFPFGLETAAARKVVRDGALPAAKIGRKLYARRSDVLALVDRLAVSPQASPSGDAAADYAALVGQAGAR